MSWRDSFSDEDGRCVTGETVGELGVQPVTVVVPAERRWRVDLVGFTLGTFVNVGNRRAVLEILVSGVVHWTVISPVVQTVGQTRIYSFGCGWGERAAFSTNAIVLSLPFGVVLQEGAVIQCRAIGFGVNDVFDSLLVFAHEWLQRV